MEIQLWHEILCPYELAVQELVVKFRHLIKEHRELDLYSPIEQVTGRVKSVSSILEKLQRKKIPFERLEEEVEDIAGIRICQFVEDIEKVAELIAGRSDMEIKSEKDYIRNMKPSGYRSYHLIVYYTVETLKGPKRLQVELQIRTMAMDFWATIEHSLQYKYKANIPEHIRKRLSAAADAIISLDNDILLNIENLYKLSNKREVAKIQDEFYRIYATNDINQLKRFHRQLDIISEGYRAQAVTTEEEIKV